MRLTLPIAAGTAEAEDMMKQIVEGFASQLMKGGFLGIEDLPSKHHGASNAMSKFPDQYVLAFE